LQLFLSALRNAGVERFGLVGGVLISVGGRVAATADLDGALGPQVPARLFCKRFRGGEGRNGGECESGDGNSNA
jgi:hypothetical protein